MPTRPETPGKRQKPKLRPLLTLIPYLAPYKGRIAAAFGALLLASAATLAVPLAVRRMIDFGFAPEKVGFINQYFIALFFLAAILAFASATRFYLVMTIGERVVADIRSAVFSHVMSLSASFYDRERVGEIVSRLTADTTQLKAAAGSSVSIALRNFFLFIGAAVLMVVSSPWLSGLVLAAIPFIVLPLVAFGRVVSRRARAAQDTLADASAFATEAIGAARTIQAFTGEPEAKVRFNADVSRSYEAARSSTGARAWLTFAIIFLVFASVVAVLWAGAHDVMAGRITAGALSQFVIYAVLAASALGELSQVWNEVNAAAGAAERIAELLAVRSEIRAPQHPVPMPEPAKGAVQFDNVSFAYPSRGDSRVLENISLQVRPGERVAVVGPSGAGKSTLFHLLLRYYDPVAGRVLIDGVDLKEAEPGAIRRRIALVPQDAVIFAASVRDNIRLGRPDASDAEVEQAGSLALVDEFVDGMVKGYDSEIGERGVTLSGGQRQRIAIARAILRDAPLLLLDEATSALDAESERLVQRALERSMEGRTSLVIAHRLATVLGADRILVMERGRIVEEGTHAALVAKGGLYARLAELQFGAAK